MDDVCSARERADDALYQEWLDEQALANIEYEVGVDGLVGRKRS